MRVLLAVLVTWIGLGLVSPAAAADDALPSGDFTIMYKGTVKFHRNDHGENSNSSYDSTVTLTCLAGRCQVPELASAAGGPFFRDPSALALLKSMPLTEKGTYTFTHDRGCGGVEAFTMTATATNLNSEASFDWQAGGCAEAPDYSEEVTFTGRAVLVKAPVKAAAKAPGGIERGNGARRSFDGSTSRLDSESAAAPSVLSALPTASEAKPTLNQSFWVAIVTLILVLLIAFPTHLLNNAIESAHGSVGAWWRARRGLSQPVEADSASVGTWLPAAVAVLAASLISSFVDPHFGLNSGSLRTFASIAISLTIESVVVWLTVIWIVRRVAPSVNASFKVAPSTLIVVVLAVLLTRLTGFEPAIVFGLVAGVAFGAATNAVLEGKVVLAGAGLALALALVGWIGYSAVDAGPDASTATRLISETLSSLAIAGIASLPIALVPLKGLAGHALYNWDKRIWGISYAVGLVGFFLILMPMPFSWSAVDTPLATWIAIYVGYATAAVGVWAAITKPWRPAAVTG